MDLPAHIHSQTETKLSNYIPETLGKSRTWFVHENVIEWHCSTARREGLVQLES
jgi:hypothetical protein